MQGAYTYFKLHLPDAHPLRALAHCWLLTFMMAQSNSSLASQTLTRTRGGARGGDSHVPDQKSNIIHNLCCGGVAIVSELSVVLLAERQE